MVSDLRTQQEMLRHLTRTDPDPQIGVAQDPELDEDNQ